MKIGFTGTRLGMTQDQADTFVRFIREHKVSEFHHGDCIGADADAHYIVDSLKISIIIHPPIEDTFRASVGGTKHTILNQKAYLERNKDIVDQTDILVATPSGFNELVRSGTWFTIRYARKCNKGIYIIFMDGTVKEE